MALTLEDMAKKPKEEKTPSLEEMASKPKKTPSLEEMAQKPKDAGMQNLDPEFAAEHPRITGALKTVTAPLRGIFNQPWVKRSGQTGSEIVFMTDRDDKVSTGSKAGDISADLMGGVLGFGMPTGGASAGAEVFGAGARAVEKGLPRLAQRLPAASRPLVQTGAKSAGGSLAYEAGRAKLNERELRPGELGTAMAADVILDVGTHGLGRALSARKGIRAPETFLTDQPDTDQLPEGRRPAAELPPGSEGTLPPGAVAQPGSTAEQPALPMTRGEAAARQQAQAGGPPQVTGEVDTSVRAGGRQQGSAQLAPGAKERVDREYAQRLGKEWPPKTTQDQAEIDFHRTLDELNQSVVQRMNRGDTSKSPWELAKEEAQARGVDLEDMYRTAIDAEYARWKDIVGISQPPVQPQRGAQQPAGPAQGELDSARNILRRTLNVDRAEKILNTYPELKPEFKRWTNRINQRKKQAPKQARQKQAQQQTPKPNYELQNVRNILKSTSNPARMEKIMNAYPELNKEFSSKLNRLKKTGRKKAKTQQGQKAQQGQAQAEEISRSDQLEKDLQNILGDDLSELKDLGNFSARITDVYRNFRDVFGDKYPQIKKKILDPFDKSKRKKVDFEEKWLSELENKIVNELGIKKGTKKSALVQRYGEGKMSLEELKKQRPNDWQDIVEADKWFRKAYDDLIDRINAERAKIYPNVEKRLAEVDQKIKEVQQDKSLTASERREQIEELQEKKEDLWRNRRMPKRKDYYRHFREMRHLTGLKNIFDSPSGIDPTLVGVSEFTQPKSKFQSIFQKRVEGLDYTEDAVGGFLDYLPAASYAIHIDPHIPKFRQLADYIADNTRESKNLNTFIKFLQDFSGDLAGKTNSLDRWIMDHVPGGRKTMAALNWLNSRVKANVILGNLGSTLSQTANIPQGVGYAKQHSVKGAGKTLKSILQRPLKKPKNDPINKSDFIKERYGDQIYRKFDTSLLDKGRNMAVWLMESSDRLGTEFIWRSAYEKALAQGAENPIKQADDVTRSLVAGRSIGEVPLAQKARLTQMVLPFQVEVGNLWNVQKDFLKEKDFTGLLLAYLAMHMFNKGMEQIRGHGVVFDPIQALSDAITEEDLSPLERGGRLAGEVLSNVPGGQTAAAIYPRYGFDAYGYEMPTREELFGEYDPTRFGVGLAGVLSKGAQDPVFKIAPPFGGEQLRKTWEGTRALGRGGSYKDGEQLRYPIEPSLSNLLKVPAFGQYAAGEAQTYFDKERRPLTKEQTRQVEGSPQQYEMMQIQRGMDTIERQIDSVYNNEDMSTQEKKKRIRELVEKRKKLINDYKAVQ